MAISFDKALGIHETALGVRSQRAEILANNLANADTPGFKARDIDFQAMLAGQMQAKSGVPMRTTNERHIATATPATGELLYRNPIQPSIDGNTVDTQMEMAEFSKNALAFQATFQFLNSKFKGLTSAIRGE